MNCSVGGRSIIFTSSFGLYDKLMHFKLFHARLNGILEHYVIYSDTITDTTGLHGYKAVNATLILQTERQQNKPINLELIWSIDM
jgi:hypothetical protein